MLLPGNFQLTSCVCVCEACSWPRGTCAAAELVELSKWILNGEERPSEVFAREGSGF